MTGRVTRTTVRARFNEAVLVAGLALVVAGASEPPGTLPPDPKILALVDAQDITALKAMGPALPAKLAELYGDATTDRKIQIAWDLYQIGLKSKEAKQALLRDLKTPNEILRVQVLYALGRVSDDPDVVDVLLDGMRNGERTSFATRRPARSPTIRST